MFAWAFARISGLITRTEPPKLFLTMSRQRTLFRGWLRFAG
ncbi:carboxymuconolactone decarboxylase family protein, partial [Solihabitans fulvus]